MKYRALWKDTFREIPKSFMRFLAILVIIFLGVGFFVGISATSPDMIYTIDDYFKQNNLMDFKVQSTYGLAENDVDTLSEIENVTVQSHYAYDFLVADFSEPIRLYSYDKDTGQAINQYHIAEGRLPQNSGEIALDTRENFLTGIKIGDTLSLADGTQNGAPEEHLITQSFEVVGFVNSPLYITHTARGNTTIGGGTLQGFGVVLETDYNTEYFTEANITVDNARDFLVFSEDYEDFIDSYDKQLQTTLTTLEERRASSIQEEAQDEINKGWADITEGEEALQNAEAELQEVRIELDDAWSEFEEGLETFISQRDAAYAELDSNEQTLNETITNLEAQRQELIDQRAQLQQQLEELNSNEQQLISGRGQLQNGITQLNEGISQIEENRPTIEAGLAEISNQKENLTAQRADLAQARDAIIQLDASLSEINNQLNTLREQLTQTAPENQAAIQAQIEALELARDNLQANRTSVGQALNNPNITVNEINQLITQLDSGLEQLRVQEQEVNAPLLEIDNLISQRNDLQNQLANLASQQQQLQDGRAQINNGITQLTNGLAQIEDGLAQANAGFTELESARTTVAAELSEAEDELSDAQAELNEAEESYQDGVLTFQEERESALADLEEGRLDLEEAEQELADLPAPDYFSVRRNENSEYTEYKDNSDRLAIIANVFPVFFFLIAIFISFTTMTRMVDEEREYIGIMKALGYGNNQILIKFLTYAMLATTIGAALGLVVGYIFIPLLIFDAYGSMYNLPSIHLQQYTLYTVIALGAAYFSTVGASLLAVKNSLRSNAATLLQPKPPAKGSHIWLEKIPFIWKQLSFNYKITFRNVFRYKSRMFMTIFGIAGSAGLVLTGFGISDAISSIPDTQYGELSHFQAYVATDPTATSNDLDAYVETTENIPEITDTLFIHQENLTLDEQGVNTQEATIFVPADLSKLTDFVTLRDKDTKEPVELTNSGAVITQKLAQLFDVTHGDEMTLLNTDNEEWTITVSGIVENYVGHTIYLTPDYFSSLNNSNELDANLNLIKYDTSLMSDEEIGRELMDQDAVLGLTYTTDIYDTFSDTLGSLELITQILVIAAAALAFIILYNLTNINVSERERELSTIKVLGFHNKEVTMYIYRENIILTLIGIFFGCIFGTVLVRFIMATMEVDNLVFGRVIHFDSYIYSILLTILFTLIVMVIIHYQLKRINMVEALKAND